MLLSDHINLVLTDTEYKSINAYQFLKEVAREVYAQMPSLSSEVESVPNLSMC